MQELCPGVGSWDQQFWPFQIVSAGLQSGLLLPSPLRALLRAEQLSACVQVDSTGLMQPLAVA